MTLRETALIPMDVSDVSSRRAFRRSCVRVSSAFDAALEPIDAGPVRKVVVALWAEREPSPGWLPERLTRDDVVVEVGRLVSAGEMLELPVDQRAVELLRLHHGAVRSVADKYGWSSESLDDALAAAEGDGIVARLSLPAVTDRGKRYQAVATGSVDEQGMHIELRITDTSTERRIASTRSTMNGDLHLLRGALNKVVWRGDTVVVEPLRRVAGALAEVPTLAVPTA